MPQSLFAQIVCLSPKVWDFDEKRLLWVSVVLDTNQHLLGQPPCCGRLDTKPGTTEGKENWGGVPGYGVLKAEGFTYSDMPNNCAANLIIIWRKSLTYT